MKHKDKVPVLSHRLIFIPLFVILAFTLMIVTSSLYVRNMLRDELHRNAVSLLVQTKIEIENKLVEPKTTLVIMANTIRNMIMLGYGADVLQDYLMGISAEITNNIGETNFAGIYGYFEAFGGVFIHSEGWEGTGGYEPAERPWYKAGVEAEGQIAVTPLYWNLVLNDYAIGYACRIFDDKGTPLGVLTMPLPLDNIRNFVGNMKIPKDGYGYLMDENLRFIAFPDTDLIGQYLGDFATPEYFSILSRELEAGNDLVEYEMVNYRGSLGVLFSTRLDNGWTLFTSTPKAGYYRSLRDMQIIISILGVFFAAALIVILMRVDFARIKADRQNREKTLLLEEMKRKREEDVHTQIMLDAMPFVANFVNKEGKIIACNEASVKLFGFKNKLEYMTSQLAFPPSPEYQPDGRLSADAAQENIKTVSRKGHHRFEWMHQNLAGDQIPCEVSLMRILYKNEPMFLSYVQDLRKLKTALKETEKANEFAMLMFNALPLSCSLWGWDMDLIDCNEEALKLLGIPDKRIYLERFLEFSPEYQPGLGMNSIEAVKAYNKKVFEEGYARVEWIHRKMNGELIPTEVSLVKVKYKGDDIIAAYIRDLTEIKKTEEELRLARDAAEGGNDREHYDS